MIVGVGCDMVDNTLTSKLDWCSDTRVLNRIFSKFEIASCPDDYADRYYSGRFAIKESILKCLGTGMEDGISLNDIEINKTDRGTLQAILNGQVKKIANFKKITTWHISLSHSRDSSVAFVIAESL